MQPEPEIEIKDLLKEVLARLSILEAKGSEANKKIEALNGKVSIIIPRNPVAKPDTEVSIPASNKSVQDGQTGPGQGNGTSRKNKREPKCYPTVLKAIPEPEGESSKSKGLQPRQHQPRRGKPVKPVPVPGAPGLALEADSMTAIRALLEIILMNAAGAVQDTREKPRIPIERTGNFVLRIRDVEGEEMKRQILEFDVPDEASSKPRSPRLTAAAMLMIALLFVGGIVVGMRLTPRTSPTVDAPVEVVAAQPFTPMDSKSVLEKFLSAPNLEEAALEVHDEDGQTLGRMREFYARPKNDGWHGTLMDDKPSRAMISGNKTFHCWRVQTPDGFIRIAPVYRVNGDVRLFWEGFVGYGSADWESFVNDRPETPVELRVLLKKAENVFVVSQNALVVEVSHPDSDHSEVVNVTDEIMRVLVESCLEDSTKPVRATVKMAFAVDDYGAKSLAITSFIGTGWGEDRLGKLASRIVTAQD